MKTHTTDFAAVRAASQQLNRLSDEVINNLICAVADAVVANTAAILKANQEDLARMGKENPMYDRLLLTAQRIEGIASDMRQVATLPSPLGRILSKQTRPNGMVIEKVSVPFGVIGVIYEARPNVTLDVFTICLKSGNACILKGSGDAHASNTAIMEVINSVLITYGIDSNTAILMPADRAYTTELLTASGSVDLIIPRGSRSLIDYVRDNAKVPVIETGAGICHAFIDQSACVPIAAAIVNNAKTRRISVCNTLDCVLIHRNKMMDLPAICAPLTEKRVIIYADQEAYNALATSYPAELLQHANPDDFVTEWLDYKLAIKTVADVNEAIAHINEVRTMHSECIITETEASKQLFAREIDAACLYINVSSAFTDGSQFGLGAEIGISTQKLHARGPMALEELTSYKYIITGEGQTRN